MNPSLLAGPVGRGINAAGVVAYRVLAPALHPSLLLGSFYWIEMSRKDANVYNMLWALVFGFATLNILGLGARRLEPGRNRASLGEMMAVMVVLLSIALL